MPARPTTDETPEPVGVKQVAEHLDTDPRSLRSFLRRTDRAAGRGKRYGWPSLDAHEVKKLATEWRAATSSDQT